MARKKLHDEDFPPDCSAIVARAANEFEGQLPELENAIGMLFLGHALGWRVLYIIHSVNTVKKYEKILGIVAKDYFPEETHHSDRSLGFRVARKLSNFWRVVRGVDTVEGARDKGIVSA